MIFALSFCLLAQRPVSTSETMTPTEIQLMTAAAAKSDIAQKAVDAAKIVLKDARKAEGDLIKKIQTDHGQTGAEPWKLQSDGTLKRSYNIIELRGSILIHTQGTDTCPKEQVRSSGTLYICWEAK